MQQPLADAPGPLEAAHTMFDKVLKQQLQATGAPLQRREAIQDEIDKAFDACSSAGTPSMWRQYLGCLEKKLHASGLPQHQQAGLLLTVIAELEMQLHKRCSALAATYASPFRAASPGSSARRSSSAGSSTAETNLLASVPVAQAVANLMALLGETDSPNKGLPGLYAKRIQELGPAAAWDTYLKAKAAHDAGTELTAEGTPRSMGGIFIKMAGKKRHAAQLAEAVQAAPATPAVPELRPYQRHAVRRITADGGNHIVVAPTGSGKTLLAVEVTRHLLKDNPAAKVVMLVPEVVLCTQQAAAFIKAGVPGAAPFSGANESLNYSNWDIKLSLHSVLVCTPQVLVNVLTKKPQALQQVQLLVLDEVHHTSKDHPYAKVLKVWRQLKDAGAAPLPQLLGLTASPASDISADGTYERVMGLSQTLDAKYYMIDEEDVEVQKVLATPTERIVEVEERGEDGLVWFALLGALIWMLREIGTAVEDAAAEAADVGDAEGYALQQLEKVRNQLVALDQDTADPQRLQRLPQAAREALIGKVSKALKDAVTAVKEMTRVNLLELRRCMHLAQEVRQALHIVEDGGHEAATSYLGRKIYELQQRCVHTLDSKQQGSAGGSSSRAGVSAGSRPGAIPAVVMAGGNNSSGSVEEDLDEDAEDEEQYAGSISSGLTYPSTPGSASTAAAGGAGWGTSAPLVQFATPSRPSNPRVAAGGVLPPVASPAGAVVEVPWGLSSWQLMQGLLERTQLGQPAAVLRSLDPIKPGSSFPRLVALVEVLKTYSSKPEFHGIVFVRQRQVVWHLAAQLRACPDLSFIDEVLEFVGHTANAAGKSGGALDVGGPSGLELLAAGQSPSSGKGMSGDQQQRVMQRFKAPGRKLLISTSAAEEGVDVPTCSFVVRYNAAVSGVQRVQSKGRARLRASEFITLLQKGSSSWGGCMASREEMLHHKSGQEENHMKRLLRDLQNKDAKVRARI